MRRLLALTLLLMVPVLFGMACSQASDPIMPVTERFVVGDGDPICGEQYVCLMAGQNMEIGSVKVWHDENCLYVDFIVDDPWVVTDTHIAVADSLEGIPQTKKGSPKIGNFPYEAGECIDVTQWEWGTVLYIAAHAVVENGEQAETAWGCGEEFDKSWAMWFNYTLEDCCKDVTLPSEEVTVVFGYPGTNSYYDTALSDVPSGYHVEDGTYLGWCVDLGHYIYPGTEYDAILYSSYDDGKPECTEDDDWDLVNYIINHKHPDATKGDIQNAIWYFIGGGDYPTDPEAIAMVEDAIANGEDWCPQTGDCIAVIVFIDCEHQVTIIEVDP
jgi:hypothetical protein